MSNVTESVHLVEQRLQAYPCVRCGVAHGW